VMFFPQLVAGPIERPQNLLPQFHVRHAFEYGQVTAGLRRMAWGLFKKVVVADRVAAYVDIVYGAPSGYHGLGLAVATVMFAFQIYFDFSAYSDIALGSAQVLGFRLMENFDRPYLAGSVSEFWRRWHISLSTWFKDYLYFPLGGSRQGRLKHCRNLLIVFLISGLWHGANWTFVIWGALHGLYLVVPLLLASRRPQRSHDPTATRWPSSLAATAATFGLVTFAWIFFRARTVNEAVYVVTNLWSGLGADLVGLLQGRGGGLPAASMTGRVALVAMVLLVERFIGRWSDIDAFVRRRSVVVRYALYVGVVYGAILGAGEGSAQQFIYFQF
jgi:alginate O-acetyltransferase complex protein AlgI